MTLSNVHQAKTNLSKLLDASAAGDDVIITRRGGAITRFKLVPVAPKPAKQSLYGKYKNDIVFATDYDKADAEIARMFGVEEQ